MVTDFMVFDFIFSIILRQTDKWVTKNWSFESISQIKSENGELSQVFIIIKAQNFEYFESNALELAPSSGSNRKK